MAIDIKHINKRDLLKQEQKPRDWMAFLNKDIRLTRTLNANQKEAFYTELEVLIKAGLDLKTALELILEVKDKKQDQKYILKLLDHIIEGDTLSEAMERVGHFSAYELSSIRIAEESGRLCPVLLELSNYYKKNLQYRRLLISALSYPVLVIGVAILSLAFLLKFLVPLFGDIYARLDQELPFLTKFIVELSEFVSTYFYWANGLILLCLIFFFLERKKTWFRKLIAMILLRMPVIGALVHQLYLARFCQAMAFLLQSKVPVLNALKLVREMVGFYPLEIAIDSASKTILKGFSLHQSLNGFKVIPSKMLALLKVGEEANQLDSMFNRLAAQYGEEVEQKTKMLGSLIEPIMIVFLALIVGLVLVAMYLPIFKLVTNFGL